MLEEQDDRTIVPGAEGEWRTRALAVGGLAGALLGVISAMLYVRAAEEAYGPKGPPNAPQSGDAIRLGVSLLGIVRTISEWGRR